MANVQAICTSFEREWFQAIHDFSVDVIKAALYETTGSLGYGTPDYSTTAEVSGMGYSAGGVIVTTAVPVASAGQITYWSPSADIVFPGMVLATPFDAVLLYNSSKANRAIGVWTFAATTLNGNPLHLYIPSITSVAALIRVSPL